MLCHHAGPMLLSFSVQMGTGLDGTQAAEAVEQMPCVRDIVGPVPIRFMTFSSTTSQEFVLEHFPLRDATQFIFLKRLRCAIQDHTNDFRHNCLKTS